MGYAGHDISQNKASCGVDLPLFDHIPVNSSEPYRQNLSEAVCNIGIFSKFKFRCGHGILEKFQRQNTEALGHNH
jgi:hypothetical protein